MLSEPNENLRVVARDLEKQLRMELQTRNIDAHTLAKRLGIVPLGGEFLLERTPWTIQETFEVANTLKYWITLTLA